jgi:hypothetical protein
VLACMVETDRGWAWGRERDRARGDVLRAGWGWIGGSGAREGWLARLGTMRGAEREMRLVVRSGGQRGGVEIEVACLGLRPERGSGERGRVYPCG